MREERRPGDRDRKAIERCGGGRRDETMSISMTVLQLIHTAVTTVTIVTKRTTRKKDNHLVKTSL